MKLRDTMALIAAIGLVIGMWILIGAVVAGPVAFAVRLLHAVLYLVAAKALTGFRFSWEKCDCCGKKHGKHEDWWRIQDLSLPKLSPEELEISKAKIKKIKAELDEKYTLEGIREGSTKSNVKSRPETHRPKGPPQPQKATAIMDRVSFVNCEYLYPPKEDVPRYHCEIGQEYEGDCPIFLLESSYCGCWCRIKGSKDESHRPKGPPPCCCRGEKVRIFPWKCQNCGTIYFSK